MFPIVDDAAFITSYVCSWKWEGGKWKSEVWKCVFRCRLNLQKKTWMMINGIFFFAIDVPHPPMSMAHSSDSGKMPMGLMGDLLPLII